MRFENDRYSPRYRETGLSPFLLRFAKQCGAGRIEVLSVERVPASRRRRPVDSAPPVPEDIQSVGFGRGPIDRKI